MKAYIYDPITREFVGVTLLDRDPMGDGWLVPANAVQIKPDIAGCADNQTLVLSDDGATWTAVDDYRGEQVFDVKTTAAMIVTAIGALPKGVTVLKPEPPKGMLVDVFDTKKQAWTYRKNYTNVTVYSVTDGSALTLSADVHDVPDGYVETAPNSEYDEWDGGTWVLNTDKQTAAQEAQRKAAIPQVVTIRQAKRALLQIELLDDVEEVMASDSVPRALKIDWENATEVKREWVESSGLMQVLDMDDNKLDQLFTLAASL